MINMQVNDETCLASDREIRRVRRERVGEKDEEKGRWKMRGI